MKNFKKQLILILVVTCCILTVGCGKSKSEDDGGLLAEKNKEMTLSEWLASDGKHVMYVTWENPVKDEDPRIIYVVENGKLTVLTTELTFGELSKMSDEEIISQAEVFAYSEEEKLENLDYKVVILTDDTGNNTKYESISFKKEKGDSVYVKNVGTGGDFGCWIIKASPNTATIYDTEYIGFHMRDDIEDDDYDCCLWIRHTDGLTLAFDTPKSKGVVVDPKMSGNEPEVDIFDE